MLKCLCHGQNEARPQVLFVRGPGARGKTRFVKGQGHDHAGDFLLMLARIVSRGFTLKLGVLSHERKSLH